MSKTIRIQPLTRDKFEPFGDILDASGEPDKVINQGTCGRFHNRARLDFTDGHAGISVFKADPRELPMNLNMMERHPEGSQAFLPMSEKPFLVIVAADKHGAPDTPLAFLTAAGQGVNYHRGVWHGVLTPLGAPGLFAVVDRIGDGANLEEYSFDEEFVIVA